MKEINDYILKISGKVSMLEPVEMGHNYRTVIEGSITTITDSDNEDGKINRTYLFKPIKVDLVNEKGQTIKTKDPRSNSKKIRSVSYAIWKARNLACEEEDFYNRFTRQIILNADYLADLVEKDNA
jgi:hypothetical protein